MATVLNSAAGLIALAVVSISAWAQPGTSSTGPARIAGRANDNLTRPATMPERRLIVGGKARTLLVYEPASAPEALRSLVIVFHGGAGSGEKISQQSELNKLAVGRVSQDINAGELMWEFFSRFSWPR